MHGAELSRSAGGKRIETKLHLVPRGPRGEVDDGRTSDTRRLRTARDESESVGHDPRPELPLLVVADKRHTASGGTWIYWSASLEIPIGASIVDRLDLRYRWTTRTDATLEKDRSVSHDRRGSRDDRFARAGRSLIAAGRHRRENESDGEKSEQTMHAESLLRVDTASA
jgi:hypothetical protein